LQRLALVCELYADRPCFAERVVVAHDGGTRMLPSFRSVTFAQLWRRIEALASGLYRAGVGEPGTAIGIAGFPSVDWVVADLACLHLAAVSVPLPTVASPDEMRSIVDGAGLACVVCGVEQLDAVTSDLASMPSVRAIVVMGLHTERHAHADAFARAIGRVRAATPGVVLRTMADVERAGRKRGTTAPVRMVAGDALRSVVYTSGSTGAPKGAMYPERVWTLYWQSPWDPPLPEFPHVSVDYMPLNHMAGRLGIVRSLVAGGVTAFVGAGDMSTLFEDIRITRPTTLLLVPRLATAIYQHFRTEAMRHDEPGHDAEAGVLQEMRHSFLGDRLLTLTLGSAPTAPEVTSFLARCFDVPVVDGYGSTEAGLIALDGRIARENVTAYEIVDVPELGYTKDDRPYPRGELRLSTRSMVPGYYRSPEATRGLFDEKGYLRTGDIVEDRGEDRIAWVDRRSTTLKLAQGEFVAVSRLEELFAAGSPFLRQVFLYGSSLWSYLLAVIVPEGIADKGLLRREIDCIAARESLRPYEVPRDFLVESEPFTRETGLLTESRKPSRPALRARYGERLEQLHTDIERRQLEELRAIETGPAGSIADTVARLLAVTLGLPEAEVRESGASFTKLGGDSLGAVTLVAHVHARFGVDLPVALVLDPTSSVAAIARAVEERLPGAGGLRRVTFAEVHGAGAETVRAEDLRVERFLPSTELAAAGRTPPLGPPVVVLTGANGFLGRFLLLELVERVAPAGGRVIAIVRAADDDSARWRLAASYGRADSVLSTRFAELTAAPGRLEVLAGDLIEPRLGLSPERWDRLASEVSAVVHPGALVNHALSYVQLFEPNVLGTVEVMRLALPRRAPIAFVSTAGVFTSVDPTDVVREDESIAALGPTRAIDMGYAAGYEATKWAGELLMHDLQGRSGIPVSVFRPSLIMPPESVPGQVNAPDLLTRLLHGVIVTGLAPRSFYANRAARHHFDGLPVDVSARAIAAIALAAQDGYHVYNVVDGHRDDGVSLDTFVEWVERAGYPVTRVDDYGAWIRAFRARLEALPPSEQQRSALPGLKLWQRPFERDLALDNGLLRERLRTLAEPSVMPNIDEAAIRRYLEAMVAVGIIGRAGSGPPVRP
jgi:fatty acid CoA ligase FadD9